MKKQTAQRISSVLQKTAVQKASVFAVAFLVIGTVAYFGTHVQKDGQALVPVPTALYLAPESGSFTTGSTFTTAVRVTSGSDPVNVVQASLTYDPAKLQFVGLAEGTAFQTVAATSTDTPGLIRVSRATQSAAVTGDNVIVTVTFKMLATTGSTNLAFDPAYSYVVRSTDNTNILATSAGASYSVRLPAPTVASVTPNSGPSTGGTVMGITGANFQNGAKVRIGAVDIATVTFVSSTTLRATTPSHPEGGAKSITVTNPDGQTFTLTNGFTYIAPPTISSLTPTSGATSGGTVVTVSGTNFIAGTTVLFGGVAGSSVTVTSATSLKVVTPARSAGTVDVTIRTPDGQQTVKTAAYTYMNPAPTVTGIVPSAGFATGGLPVTITGSNFGTGTTVTIGGLAASNVIVVNPTTITAKTPARATGLASIVVKNADGQSATLANAFTYRASGDVNADGRVNALDLSSVITKDGQSFSAADFNADGTVGAADMAMLLSAWTW